jgi:CubicO group peptidase (beta-lactamase class C family)
MSIRLACILIVAALVGAAARPAAQLTDLAASVEELRHEIDSILSEGNTAAAAIAVVQPRLPAWAAGFGFADRSTRREATAATLFRIGSVSKQFVSLAILQMAERGEISLNDPVRKLAPDIHFENPWEATDPVRIVHLLEHTTGWDDIRLRDYAQDGSGMDLRSALDFGRRSRVSRWRPGTRTAYCNSGPAVAAYIVERLSGMRFEEFVARHLFTPIGMASATYQSPPPDTIVTLYGAGGVAAPYWHVLYRPSGAINASARDMAAYLQFLVRRGSAAGEPIVTNASFERMEMPVTTWAAQQGIGIGHGLTTARLIRDGFVWLGHSGELIGALSELWYIPGHGVGYFTSITSDNGFDSFRIGQAVRRFLLRDLTPPSSPVAGTMPAQARDFRGWYEPASPRMQIAHFLQRLTGLAVVHVDDKKLTFDSATETRNYVPVDGLRFRRVFDSPPQDPIPTLGLLDTGEGRFVQLGTEATTMKQIPSWLALGQLAGVAYVVLAMAAVLAYAPFWTIERMRGRSAGPHERRLQLLPLLAVGGFVSALIALAGSSGDPITRLGSATVWSIGLSISTVLFVAGAAASAIAIVWTPRHAVRPRVRRFSIAVTGALLILSGYLAYWGVIGIRTWE